MFKKTSLIMLSLLIVAFFSTLSYTQDQPVKDDKKAVEETKKDAKTADTSEAREDIEVKEVKGMTKSDAIMKSSEGAKSYFDGHNTFINPKVQLELKSRDNVLEDKIFYKIDGGEAKEYTGPFSIDKEGKHIITYFGVDKVGNQENTKDLTVIVDHTPPDATVIMNAPFIKVGDKLYVSDKFVYTYSINTKDAISGVANVLWSTDGTNFKEYVSPFQVAQEWPINMRVIVKDNVFNITDKYVAKIIDDSGNVIDYNPETIKIIVDKTSPVVAIKPDKDFIDKEGKKIASKAYKYSISATDGEAGIESIVYKLDSRGDFIPYTGEIVFTTNGEHLIEAVSKDKVGNISNTATLSVFVDTVPPDTEIKMMDGSKASDKASDKLSAEEKKADEKRVEEKKVEEKKPAVEPKLKP